MGVQISYMGNKTKLADEVANIVSSLPNGTMLDAFSGMCNVAEAVGPKRQIWINDVLAFPAAVGRSLLCAPLRYKDSQSYLDLLLPFIDENLARLQTIFKKQIRLEANALSNQNICAAITQLSTLRYVGNSGRLERVRKKAALSPEGFPYNLFAITYGDTYWGIQQCLQLDSIRYAIDRVHNEKCIAKYEREWLLVALGTAACKTNSSTGHFAEPLRLSQRNATRILSKRRLDVVEQFRAALTLNSAIGTPHWRKSNRAYQSDALTLLKTLERSATRPSIVYADPPYSEAQYSRYYHVLDTLIHYDYPQVSGQGRYRLDRFQSTFSHSARVAISMEGLASAVSSLGATLVLSYPSNGLYCRNVGGMKALLRKYFKKVELAHRAVQRHSTFGANRTSASVPAVEQIFLAVS